MKITEAALARMSNPQQVKDAIFNELNVARAQGPESIISFFNHYATWNGYFAGCMTRLAADISEAKESFIDKNAQWLNDRSNVVASYIFDTVRDEFDDSGTEHRDTHRTLAQALIFGLISYYEQFERVDVAKALAPKPIINYMLRNLQAGFNPQHRLGLMEGIGFHLGSEFFGDVEYTAIDDWFEQMAPGLKKFLKNKMVNIDGVEHNAYAWIKIHSGNGDAVEADHLQVALAGANRAVDFINTHDKDEAAKQVYEGARNFANHQKEFFLTVSLNQRDSFIHQTHGRLDRLLDEVIYGIKMRFAYRR